MKDIRFQYVITFLLFGFVAWFIYLRVVFANTFSAGLNETKVIQSFINWCVRTFNLNEFGLKLTYIVSPVVASFFYKYYSDKDYKIIYYYILIVISLLFLIYPASNLIHLNRFLGITISIASYLTYLYCLIVVSRYFYSKKLNQDQFNEKNQSFDQEKSLIKSKFSINLTYKFIHKGKIQKGFLNFVNIFRSVWVWGVMGSGKTFNFLVPFIHRLIGMRFSMLVYDLKFPELSTKTYNFYEDQKPEGLGFYQMCLTDMRYSHRCNPIEPLYIPGIIDIENACTTVFKNLKEPDEQESAFFKNSALGLFVALVAISKDMALKYDKPFCSLPHVTLLSSVKIKYLLPILLNKKDIISSISSLRDAFDGGAAEEQLAGQTASLQNKLKKLVNLDAFYSLSGKSDFSLDLNNPKNPKILVIGGDMDKTNVIAPYLSLIVEMVAKKANMPNKHPFALVVDELSSFYFSGLLPFLESGRQNLCALIAGIQGIPQLLKKYSRAEADSMVDIQGSVVCGMAGTKTAEELSKRIGKTNQKRSSLTQSAGSISMNHSFYREDLIPVSRISNFSQAEFCGIVADEFDNEIEQKRFLGKMDMDDCHKTSKSHSLPKIFSFKNDSTDRIFKEHWEAMRACDFFNCYYDALIENQFIFIPKEVKFYINYLKMNKEILDNEHFNLLKNIKKEDFDRNHYFREYFSNRLEDIILSNEKQLFLNKYQDKLYSDIEFWVRSEYELLTGDKIKGDLFNIDSYSKVKSDPLPF